MAKLCWPFDTGPGNAPIDDWMQRHTATPVDSNGDLARTGKVDDVALTAMLANPFFDRVPPKSLDRMGFRHGGRWKACHLRMVRRR